MKKYRSDKMPLSQYMYVLGISVKKSIKQQYRNSVLGVLWTVLNPLLNMIVMAIVFSTLFRRTTITMDYPCYLFAGNIIFGLMRGATTSALPCIVENRDLMTKTRVPTTTFVIAKVLTALANFGFSLIALLAVMLVRYLQGYEVVFSFSMVLAIAIIPALVMFSLGISFILSALYVKFRDIKHLYGVFITLWMYVTPLFYAVEDIEDMTVQSLLHKNPMYYFVMEFRNVFVAGQMPDGFNMLICYACGIVSLVLGLSVFQACKKSFVVNI